MAAPHRLAAMPSSATAPSGVLPRRCGFLETPTVFQAIGAAAIIGIAMFYVLEFIEKRVVFWAQVEME
jgi:hypothetical protein